MSSSHDQLQFVKAESDKRIKSISSRRGYYRSVAFYSFMSTSVLAAVTAIILGLNVQQSMQVVVKTAALIISAIITVINAFNAFYNHRELWIGNNHALNRFYKLKFDIAYCEQGGTVTQQDVNGFRDTYQNILDELNEDWGVRRLKVQAKKNV